MMIGEKETWRDKKSRTVSFGLTSRNITQTRPTERAICKPRSRKATPIKSLVPHDTFEGFTAAGTGKLFSGRFANRRLIPILVWSESGPPGKKLVYALWRVYLEELAFPDQFLVLRPLLGIRIESLTSLIDLKFIE